MSTLTATQAARRLGVRIETLYAYVSRGLLESHPAEDGRSSRYDTRAIEALARRGRPRQSSRSSSLNLLIETRITSLSSTGPRYRGHLASDLARTHTFENVADLLWLGALGTDHRIWHGALLTGDEALPVNDAIRALVARTATAPGSTAPGYTANGHVPIRVGTDWQPGDVAAAGRHLIATIVGSLPPAGDGRSPRLVLPAGGSPIRATVAGRLWGRLSPRRPAPGLLAVLNAALVLLADHDLAASTLGVRVAASTRASPNAVVTAGLGVLSGPYHGGASRMARALLDEAAEVGAARAVGALLRSGQRAPGFGHSVYVGVDPRAVTLLELLRSVAGANRSMLVADAVCTEVRERVGQEPNVDLALAAMSATCGMPADSGEAVMSIARIAGWLAHATEEYGEQPLRFRPRASYVGEPPRPAR